MAGQQDAESLAAALAGRYHIRRELGQGGMATVYLAEDLRHHREVAIKVLRPELAAALGPERFLREIAITARLDHPHILALLDSGVAAPAGSPDGRPYYVMPFVEGESLRDRLTREKQLPVDDALTIACEVADALGHAHSRGIIHRDIKPENILLAGGHARVADFGIARAVGVAGGESLTRTGLTIGTPAYMSPEQGAGQGGLDGRSDLYALGCVLYEMLAGQPPFTGPTAQSIMARHSLDTVPPLRTVRATVPAAVERAVLRALAKVPADRFATVSAFRAALAGATGPVAARREPQVLPRRRRPGLLLALAGAVVLALGLWQFTRWRAGRASADANLVAVLPFRIAGADPGLAWLREGMVDLLAIKLSGAGGLRAAEPRSVLSTWDRVAGSESGEPSPEAALGIARRLGAGLVVDGSVAGTSAHLALTASLLSAPGGRSVARTSVEGPADSLSMLVDRLAAQLLTLESGIDVSRLSSITTTSLPAIRAYLAGRAAFRRGSLGEAFRSFREATLLDSTFALAALELVHASVWVGGAWSEDAERGKRLAQAGRDRLSQADRTLLDAWSMEDITGPDWIAAWQAASRAHPDRAEIWYELGDAYYHNGALVGLNDPLRLAKEAFQRGWAIDSANGADSLAIGRSPIVAEPLVHMVEIAQMEGDTASVRRLVALRLGTDSTGANEWYLRWHRAFALGESARRAFWADSQRVAPTAWGRICQFVTWTGIGIADLRRVTDQDIRHVETGHPGEMSSPHALALLNGGRPTDARRILHIDDSSPEDLTGRINDALYWGGDTAAAADAARKLAPLAAAVARPGHELRPDIHALCAVSAWHAAHGDYGYVEAANRRLRAEADAGRFREDSLLPVQSAALCSALLEAARATALHLPDARASLERADVAARTYILSAPLGANLAVARAAEAQGDLALSLRALRRRGSGVDQFPFYFSTFLREEGRIAGLTGDTAGAVRAYQHYLALRPNPEPEVKPEVDQVRTELGRLLEEHPRP
jgi:TolB-like protein